MNLQFPIKVAVLSFLSFLSSAAPGSSALKPIVVAGDPADQPTQFLYFARQNNSHHNPQAFLTQLRHDFGERGITLQTSVVPADLNLENLNNYHGIFFFGNHGTITTTQIAAVDTYLNNGGGMVGLHVMAFVARENPAFRPILGGAFRGHHSISSFTPQLIQSAADYPDQLADFPNFPFTNGETYAFDPSHPILDGLETYTSADEPYLHQFMSTDIILLGYRTDIHSSGTIRWHEPYTWVRENGAGKVFYHANGHDSRTWSEPNFQELMIRGSDWVSKDEPATHQTLLPPTLSETGKVQHLSMTDVSGNQELTLSTDHFYSARSGNPVPGHDESLLFQLTAETPHSALSNDQVAFSTSILSNGGTHGALLVGHPRYPTLLAMGSGDADLLEAGFQFSSAQDFPFVTDLIDTVLFRARIEDSAGGNQKNTVAIYENESLSPLLIEGDPLPSDPLLTVVSIPEKTLYCSANNQVGLIADLQSSSSPSTSHLLAGAPDTLSSWLSVNQSYPGLPIDTVFSEFLEPVAIHEGKLIFTAQLSGPSVTLLNDTLIASTDQTGTIEILLREGDQLNSQDLTFPSGTPSPLAKEDQLIVPVLLAGVGSIASLETNSSPTVLASESQSFTFEGMTYSIDSLDFDSLMISQSQVVLSAVLLGPDGITTSSSLLQIGSGLIRPLIIEGEELLTDQGLLTVSSFDCQPTGPHGSGLNNSNKLAALITATNSTTAIVEIENIDDFDQDQISDTIEIAFGGSAQTPDDSLPAGYPQIFQNPDGTLNLTYWRLTSSDSNLEYRLQSSVDLENWTTTTPITTESDDQTGVPSEYRQMDATIPTSDEKRFFRFAF